MITGNLTEKLAEYSHNSWSGWMEYMMGLSFFAMHGSIIIPPSLVKRWQRQMNTTYENLSEEEKESDRREAIKILNIINGFENAKKTNINSESKSEGAGCSKLGCEKDF